MFADKVGTDQSQTCCLLCCLYQSPEEQNVLLLLQGELEHAGQQELLRSRAGGIACWLREECADPTLLRVILHSDFSQLLLWQDSSRPSLIFRTAKFSFTYVVEMAALPLRQVYILLHSIKELSS